MKTWILPVMLMIMIGQASAALVATGSSLDATLLYYEPVPAQPGDLLDVRILITNSGGSASKGGTIKFVSSYPFTIENSAEKTQKFPVIPAQESFLIRTRVRVDKAASEGTNLLTVVLQESNQAQLEKNFDIAIQGRTSALTVTDAHTEPAMIPPGASSRMTITLRNIGDSRLRNVNVNLDLTDLSLAPAGGSASQTIDSLAGGASHIFTFGLTAFPSAQANAYKVPVTITYDDERGNEINQTKTVGLVIGAEPELLVYFDQMNIMENSKSGEVIIRFVNKGLSEIKLLEAQVIESDDVKVLSESPIVYVGNIDEDDYETADMTLEVSGEVDVPIKIRYRDALNQPYEQQILLHVTPKEQESQSHFSFSAIIIVLLIAGLIFMWWRGQKRRGKR